MYSRAMSSSSSPVASRKVPLAASQISKVRSVFMLDSILNLGRDCPRAESHAAAQAVRAAEGAREHGLKVRAEALTVRTACKIKRPGKPLRFPNKIHLR